MMSQSHHSKDNKVTKQSKSEDTYTRDKKSKSLTHVKSPKEFTHTFYPYGGTDIVKNLDHLIQLINTTG